MFLGSRKFVSNENCFASVAEEGIGEGVWVRGSVRPTDGRGGAREKGEH